MPLLRHAVAIRFVMDREECFSHNVDYEGDTVHVSFVVIKAETPWHYSEDGVDLVVWFSFSYSSPDSSSICARHQFPIVW